ncbi:hypothetical protein LCGC14_3120730, partial [marine sediment metagenome]
MKKQSSIVNYQSLANISPFNKGGLRGIFNHRFSTINYFSSKGFSLVEVMVAAIILGVSLMAIYAVYIKTFEASGRAESKTVATSLAQETMENVINRPYNN